MQFSCKVKRGVPGQLYPALVTLVIDSIPAEWNGVRAWLHAPGELVRSGRVDVNMKWVFESTITQPVQRVTPRNDSEVLNRDPDIVGLLIGERKLPLEVEIGGLVQNQILKSREARQIVRFLVTCGYNGRFSFRPYSETEDRREKQSKCEIWIPHEGGNSFIPQFNVESAGKDISEIEPILQALESIRFTVEGNLNELAEYANKVPVCGA